MRKNHRHLGKIRKIEILCKLSKATYFDRKWENRDINVVEQTNIPQFSELDDIGTSLRHFESFFVNALVDMIAG